MADSLISIIIPTYNNYTTLAECLLSVYAQSYKTTEVIVVDDGSREPEKIKSIVDQFDVDVFVRQDNQGAPAARNVGFEKAKGEYVIFVDADVIMQPEMLKEMYQILSDSKASFCYSAFYLGKKLIRYVPFAKEKLQQQNFAHTTSLILRSTFPGFDTQLKKFQDWDVWLTIVQQGGVGIGIDKPLFTVQKHKEDTMSKWLPSILYVVPWPILGFTPKSIKKYNQAREVIVRKHHL